MRFRWLILGVLLAALLAPLFVSTQPVFAQQQTHTVKAGENLFRIALQYGTTWPVLAAANNLVNPNLIYVGRCW